MAVAVVMTVLVMLPVIRAAELHEVVAGVSGIVMVFVFVNMRAHSSRAQVSVQASRRPDDLEGDDKHDDQGDIKRRMAIFYRLRRICQAFVYTVFADAVAIRPSRTSLASAQPWLRNAWMT